MRPYLLLIVVVNIIANSNISSFYLLLIPHFFFLCLELEFVTTISRCENEEYMYMYDNNVKSLLITDNVALHYYNLTI